ncbi:MAG: RNA polymerase Rpb4 family protein [Candidatus Thermoplasmatota archaeon]|nr:RNA polymerase Rpb4 family protein [Candidatus Thermoplasmatota archaeon]MCK4458001.1 RNA polymerase [Thermoplasmata archaeon]
MDEKLLSLGEVKKLLEKEAKVRELAPEQLLALQHTEAFARLSPAKAKKLVKELTKLEHVSEFHAYKIADLLPTHPDDVRAVFAKERFTLGKEEIEKVIKIVENYL